MNDKNSSLWSYLTHDVMSSLGSLSPLSELLRSTSAQPGGVTLSTEQRGQMMKLHFKTPPNLLSVAKHYQTRSRQGQAQESVICHLACLRNKFQVSQFLRICFILNTTPDPESSLVKMSESGHFTVSVTFCRLKNNSTKIIIWRIHNSWLTPGKVYERFTRTLR